MKQAICYTIFGCPKCQSVMRYLNKKDVDFEEVNIMEQPERANEVENVVGEIVTPVLIVGSKAVVGDDLGGIERILFGSGDLK
ncbi:glutaredoxin [Scopulibacillus darangshiensis]|uniref:Glutaredoxin n=1 Tax=Scopulibacillus darangshiensis TaxID=442528 RepID=A0A4R2P580_9BACL|nr:glutaredoxin family protein [Scopulibacillus darangshiensis]TCP29932.1 glutaredoxin [Scopulibacillus darangshiensis]